MLDSSRKLLIVSLVSVQIIIGQWNRHLGARAGQWHGPREEPLDIGTAGHRDKGRLLAGATAYERKTLLRHQAQEQMCRDQKQPSDLGKDSFVAGGERFAAKKPQGGHAATTPGTILPLIVPCPFGEALFLNMAQL